MSYRFLIRKIVAMGLQLGKLNLAGLIQYREQICPTPPYFRTDGIQLQPVTRRKQDAFLNNLLRSVEYLWYLMCRISQSFAQLYGSSSMIDANNDNMHLSLISLSLVQRPLEH